MAATSAGCGFKLTCELNISPDLDPIFE